MIISEYIFAVFFIWVKSVYNVYPQKEYEKLAKTVLNKSSLYFKV